MKSEWVTTEWGVAWALQKRITPILIGLQLNQLPERLRLPQVAKYENIKEYLTQVKQRALEDVS